MRVLVVEDDEEMAELVATGLRGARMAVDVALDGQAGLERHESFDLASVTAQVLDSRRDEASYLGLDVRTAICPAPLTGDPTPAIAPRQGGGLRAEVAFPAPGVPAWPAARAVASTIANWST